MALQPRSKVLVVGLDGATLDLISPMISQGKLPNLAKIATTGIRSKLRSTILPLSPTAWASFATGKNAGKHGIYDFSKRSQGSYEYRPTTSLDHKSLALWDIIGALGGKSIVVNVPLTYPAKQINGVMITGFPTPSNVDDFIYPQDVLPVMETTLGRRLDIRKPTVLYQKGHEKETTRELIEITRSQTEITQYLMRKLKWNFAISVYDATDVIGHYFWAYLDKDHPKYDKRLAASVRGMVEEIHIELDKAIGELVESAGKDTLVLVVSDHGFGPVYYGVYINNWLLERKYMYFKNNVSVRAKYWAFRRGFNTYNLLRVAKKIRLVRSIESAYSTRSWALSLLRMTALSMEDIDWDRTKVYSSGNLGQLYVNLEGREPKGIVSREEADQLIDEVVSELKKLEDPRTGGRMFDNIYKSNDIFNGAASIDSPDIVFFDEGMKYSAHRMFELGSNKLVTPHPIYSGNHKMDGIFFAAGKGVKHIPNMPEPEPSLVDLAPTVLHYMGYYVPRDMDGRILREYFEASSEFAQQEIEYALESEMLKIQQSLRKLNANHVL